MKRACGNCGTAKFGLVRYWRGCNVFCSKKCLKAWMERQKARWLDSLYNS